jgi:hypothetical protein
MYICRYVLNAKVGFIQNVSANFLNKYPHTPAKKSETENLVKITFLIYSFI